MSITFQNCIENKMKSYYFYLNIIKNDRNELFLNNNYLKKQIL